MIASQVEVRNPISTYEDEERTQGEEETSQTSPLRDGFAQTSETATGGNVKTPPIDNYEGYLKNLREEGKCLRSDKDQPSLLDKPVWFDEELFKNAHSVYQRHFMALNFAHLSGLLLLVRVDSIYKTLSSTGQSDSVSKLFKRYYNTLKHVKRWYEGNLFEENDEAYRSLLIVRSMHNKVSSNLNDLLSVSSKADQSAEHKEVDGREKKEEKGDREEIEKLIDEKTKLCPQVKAPREANQLEIHISEYDVFLTQFAFIGFIVTNANKVGLIEDFSEKDLASLLHFWRVIGYYLGASERCNLCSYEKNDILGLCKAIMELEYKESMIKNPLVQPPGIMSVNIVRSVKFIPMLTIYGILRHLYEILDYELTEIESKRNWYSNLSYTLINLVMTRLLAYKPFRSFNNGLTRLSIFLIGKIENWFSARLESTYGQELKI